MKNSVRIVLAQLNFTVGDILENSKKIIEAIHQAKSQYQADIIVFPEMAITGYPAEDLLYRPYLYKLVKESLEQIRQVADEVNVVVGHPQQSKSGVYNAATWVQNKKILTTYFKQKLPNTRVFDEVRYFESGTQMSIVKIKNISFAILVCEDVWYAKVVEQAKQAGAQGILVLNASPYSMDKSKRRHEMLQDRVKESGLPIVYVNMVGGQDELVFDGDSLVIDSQGDVCAQTKYFEEQLLSVQFDVDANNNKIHVQKQILPKTPEKIAQIYQALTVGVRDYVHKNGFKEVILGLSGGIDSSLSLTIAVDALGAKNVTALMMPTEFTSEMSLEDSATLSKNLGVQLQNIDIQSVYETFLKTLQPSFAKTKSGVTEENIQARVRAVVLMALSNKFNKLVLTTGNKSELATGYCTLYGDMAGAFCVLKDIYKTLVYELAHYRNNISSVIPERIITRAPSAELAPNQTDQNTLPPYDVLDQILELFIDRDLNDDEIVECGFDQNTVEKIVKMVLSTEYKRRQAPPGVRITQKAFGRDRRYPITSGYLKNIVL